MTSNIALPVLTRASLHIARRLPELYLTGIRWAINYIYANGDDHLKNFSLILRGQDYRLAPAYDLLNTSLHVRGDDFGLDGGLAPNISISGAYANTGHPGRLDFEHFGERIGLVKYRMGRILDKYMQLPETAAKLVGRSFLNDKMKRSYLRIVKERIARFTRESD